MDKQTLEKVLEALVNDYLKRKDEILKDELSDNIDCFRADQQRSKLIGMNYAMDIVRGMIKDIH